MENKEAYQRAKRRVEVKIGFYIHLAVYIVVSGSIIKEHLIEKEMKRQASRSGML